MTRLNTTDIKLWHSLRAVNVIWVLWCKCQTKEWQLQHNWQIQSHHQHRSPSLQCLHNPELLVWEAISLRYMLMSSLQFPSLPSKWMFSNIQISLLLVCMYFLLLLCTLHVTKSVLNALHHFYVSLGNFTTKWDFSNPSLSLNCTAWRFSHKR